jgi:hypothetical protein
MDEDSSNKNLENRIQVKGDCPKCHKHTIFEKSSKEVDSVLTRYSQDKKNKGNDKEYYLCRKCYHLVESKEIRDYYDFQVNGSRKKIKEKLNRENIIFP